MICFQVSDETKQGELLRSLTLNIQLNLEELTQTYTEKFENIFIVVVVIIVIIMMMTIDITVHDTVVEVSMIANPEYCWNSPSTVLIEMLCLLLLLRDP